MLGLLFSESSPRLGTLLKKYPNPRGIKKTISLEYLIGDLPNDDAQLFVKCK